MFLFLSKLTTICFVALWRSRGSGYNWSNGTMTNLYIVLITTCLYHRDRPPMSHVIHLIDFPLQKSKLRARVTLLSRTGIRVQYPSFSGTHCRPLLEHTDFYPIVVASTLHAIIRLNWRPAEGRQIADFNKLASLTLYRWLASRESPDCLRSSDDVRDVHVCRQSSPTARPASTRRRRITTWNRMAGLSAGQQPVLAETLKENE